MFHGQKVGDPHPDDYDSNRCNGGHLDRKSEREPKRGVHLFHRFKSIFLEEILPLRRKNQGEKLSC
jgi:hypothetical protein